MKKLENLAAGITGGKVLILLALQFVLQGLIVFVVYPLVRQGGGPPLDMQMFYEPSMVGFYLASIGEAGRSWYMINQLTLDLLFPLAYGSAYIALFLWLMKKAEVNIILYRLALIPLAIVVSDIIENVTIVVSIAKFPAIPGWLESGAAIASAAKQSAIAVTMTVAVVLLAVVLGKYLKRV